MSKPGAYKKTLKTDLTASAPVALDDSADDLSLGVSGVLPTSNGGTGNANGTVAKLTTARTISLTGAVTGSGSFDGSGDVSIATTGDMSGSYVDLTSAQSVGGRKTFTDEPYCTRPVGDSCMIYSQSTGGDYGTVRIGFGVSGSGINRGIFDQYLGRWMIYYDAEGNLRFDNGEYLAAPGTVALFAGSSIPSGWLLCNGATVSRTTYARLYASIGTTWGSGDGSTTFGLPDCRNRFPLGVGDSSLAARLSAGLPEITGGSSHNIYMSGQSTSNSGALRVEYQDDGGTRDSVPWAADGAYGMYYMRLYASYSSSIYGGASTVQPPALAFYYMIKT